MKDLMTSQQIYKEHGFFLIKNFIPIFFAQYLKEILNTLKITGNLKSGDGQVKNSFCVYGNPAFDTFGMMSTGMISNVIGINLLPTYTYSRIYLNGSDLKPHMDRPECEHSATIFLGGEMDNSWPIWVQKENSDPVSVALDQGDALVYQGNKILHWREEFKGNDNYQLFMHYVDANGAYKDRLFDSRPYIGLNTN